MTRKTEAYAFVPYVIYEDFGGLRHVQFGVCNHNTVRDAVEHESSLRRIIERPGITIIDSGYKSVAVQYEQRI